MFVKTIFEVNEVIDVEVAPGAAPAEDAGTDEENSEDWLGVIFAEDGVVSTVTVLSVSSPGDIEVKLISGGDNKSKAEDILLMGLLLTLTVAETLALRSSFILGIISVSGVPSTEILRRDMESSEDNVFEDNAWEP